MELPQNIRQELKDKYELQLINLPVDNVPTTSYAHQPLKSNTNNQMNDTPMNEIDIDNNTDITNNKIESDSLFVESSSPTLVSQSIPDLPSWSQLDPDALLALPESMQKQILEAYKKMGKKKQEKNKNSVKSTISIHSSSTNIPIRNDSSKITKLQHSRINGKQKEKINDNACTLTQIYAPSNKGKFKDIVVNLNEKNIKSNHCENIFYETNNNGVDHPIDMDIWSELPKGKNSTFFFLFKKKQYIYLYM